MLPDDRLHSFRTRHRRLPTHQPRASSERERDTLPEGVKESGSNVMLRAEKGGGGEVVALCRPHFLEKERQRLD